MEELTNWEQRLRDDLDASVRDVRAGDDLLATVRAGGRRRVRRRRALTALPAAVVIAGTAVWAGVHRSAPPPVAPASQGPTPSRTPEPRPTPVPTSGARLEEQAAVDLFYDSGYVYEDAVALGELWNLDSWEAKAQGGRWIEDGRALPDLR